MISFYWPGAVGEWMAFTCAAITIAFGLLLFLAPRLSFKILRLQTRDGARDAIAEARATMAGFYLASGLCCILLAQPLIYLVLGLGWGFTAFGRLVSIVADRAGTRFNWMSLIIEGLLAAMPLVFVFGII